MQSAIDDRETIKIGEVEDVVRELSLSYFLVRDSFFGKKDEIEELIKLNDITEVVRLMKEIFSLPKNLVKRVGYSTTMESLACIDIRYRSDQPFNLLEATMYFKESKDGMKKLSSYAILHMIAHELSHVRLRLDAHKYYLSEFATDVFALMVAGNEKDFKKNTYTHIILGDQMCSKETGYIRRDLCDEVFIQLRRYAEIWYIK